MGIEREGLISRATENTKLNIVASSLLLLIGLSADIPLLTVLGAAAFGASGIVAGIHEVKGILRRNSRRELRHLPPDYET